MTKRRHMATQVIGKLREAEALMAKGMTMEAVLRWLGVSQATYQKWQTEYEGLQVDQPIDASRHQRSRKAARLGALLNTQSMCLTLKS